MSTESVYPKDGVRPYDPHWPAMYRATSADLDAALGGWVTEHIGSTSVAGLVAKPVIDIAARVPTGAQALDRE